MRFLDHISVRKVITEAGINDVGVMLDRLASEIMGIVNGSEENSYATNLVNVYVKDITTIVQRMVPIKAAPIKNQVEERPVTMDYAKAMWLAKMIRLQIVFEIDKEFQRFVPQDKRRFPPLPPTWAKYADKIYRTSGLTTNPEQEPAVTFNQYAQIADKAAIFYTKNENQMFEQFMHISDLSRVSKEVASVNWEGFDAMGIIKKCEVAEREWIKNQPESKDIAISSRDKIIIDETEIGEPGWFWVYMARGYCSDEARSMGHCARTANHLISLRQVTQREPKSGRPLAARSWATAEYQPSTKTIGELKGPANGKPGEDQEGQSLQVIGRNAIVRKAIAALFRWSEVHGFRNQTYRADSNFRPDDLEDEHFDTLPTDRPGLFVGSMKNWIRTQGDDINSLIAYVNQRENKKVPLNATELNAFSPDALRAVMSDTSLLPKGSVEWGKSGPKTFIKAFEDNGIETLQKYVKAVTSEKSSSGTGYLGLVTDDLLPFNKKALREFLPDHSYHSLDRVNARPYIKAFGQTKEMADLLFKNKDKQVGDTIITDLQGDALVRMFELTPQTFRIENFKRVREAQGKPFTDDFEAIREFAKTGGHHKLDTDDFDSKQMQELFQHAPQWFSMDAYLRHFSTGDMLVDEMIKEIDGEIGADQIDEMEPGTRNAIVDHMIEHAPWPLANAYMDVTKGYNPQTKMFIIQEYKDVLVMIEDGFFNSNRSDNSIKGIASNLDDDDHSDSHWPWQKPEEFADDILTDEELQHLIEYARDKYPDEFETWEEEEGEIDVGEDAIRFVRETNDDDPLITALNYAYESGAQSGYQDSVAKDVLRVVDNSRVSFGKIPFLILFDHGKGDWSGEAKFGCEVEAGFEPKEFGEILKNNDLRDTMMRNFGPDEFDNGFYQHDRQHDYSNFDKEAAIDVFYDNMPSCDAETKMQAVRKKIIDYKKSRGKGLAESLAARLKW